jgi:hypothetical protein
MRITRPLVTVLGVLALLVTGPAPAAPLGATPARQAGPEIGAVWTVALDAAGDGWAWANPAPQTFATTFLLRIESGAWRIAADSTSNPDLLPPGLQITRMAITADGRDGWATGRVEDAEEGGSVPMIWRLENGAWRVGRHNLGDKFYIEDLTVSADGAAGWMTGFDTREPLAWRLLRLRNGAWDFVDGPATGGRLSNVAVSPDGQHGWAVGPSTADAFAEHNAFRWRNGAWEPVGPAGYRVEMMPTEIKVDNAGNGWLTAIFAPDLAARAARTAARLQAFARPAAQTVNVLDALIRLRQDALPEAVPLELDEWAEDPEANFYLTTVGLDALGRGWAAGAFELGVREEPPELEFLYQPLMLRLDGDTVTPLFPEEAGLDIDSSRFPAAMAVNAAGTHSWLGAFDGYGFGHLNEVWEPWLEIDPFAAAPLPGPGRCFAEVDNCLRGVFAAYWEQHGGLAQFGFPITPEVEEAQGETVYTVQYTERARLEYHPENAPPYDVLLGLLGNDLADPRAAEAPFRPAAQSIRSDVQWFAETQHNVGPPFLAYWQSHGGLPVFGLPRSEAFEEENAADGKVYRVQYFERNRIEHHPEYAGTSFEFLLGLLGVEQFTRTYGYTP